MGKSKFLTFLFSMVPGLGHFYLGFFFRGLLLMAAFFGWLALSVIIVGLRHGGVGLEAVLFLAPLLIIWVCSLFDALHLQEKGMRPGEDLKPQLSIGSLRESTEFGDKSRLWALIFSIVPGAGHMYLGWQEKGLQLMLTFFMSLFLIDWLGLSLFLFLLPVIWFYAFFDTMQLASATPAEPLRSPEFAEWVARRSKLIGFGLVALGGVIVFDRMVAPLLHFRALHILRSGIVASILIGGGVRLIRGKPIGGIPGVDGTDDEAKHVTDV